MAQAAATTVDNNPTATAAANTAAAQGGTAVDSQGNAITGFGNGSTSQPAQPNFNSINSTNLNPATPVNVPPPVQAPDTSGAVVGGAKQTAQSAQQIADSLQIAPTALDQQQQSILDSIASLTGQDAQKGQDTANAQAAAGIPGMQTNVQNLTNNLNNTVAQYDQLNANLGGNNSVETKAVLAAQQAGVAKAKAAAVGVAQAQLTAAQGNLSLAQQQVTDAINLKYSTIEGEIATQKAQLDAIQPLLNQEQKTEALAQQEALKQQDDAIAQQKADETAIQNVALEAAKAGASSDVVSAIENASDPIAAIAAAAPALGAAATAQMQQQAFDNNIKLQQLYISQADLSLKEQQQADEMSPQNLFAYAQQYAATGSVPSGAPAGSQGVISKLAASLPKSPGTIYDGSTGVAPSKLNSTQENAITGLYNIINNVLPQLSGNYTPGQGIAGGLVIANKDDYNSAYSDLSTALTALSSSGILKGSAQDYISQIPDASHWYSSGIYTTQGKQQITSLTNALTQQLTSYLNVNNLKLAGFNDTTTASDSSDPNADSNLSQFFSK